MSDIIKVVGRPAKAEVWRWTGNFRDLPADWRATGKFSEGEDGILLVLTGRGPVPCYIGEYVIRRVTRDFYPIDSVTFAERWEEQ